MFAKNNAGGIAYQLSDKDALVNIALNGFINQNDQNIDVKKTLDLLKKVSSDYLFKLALFSREYGQMKDMPIFITAYLTTTNFSQINTLFETVVTDFKSLARYVHYMRNGDIRKSLGTKAKRLVSNFLKNKSDKELFFGSFGMTPALKDIIKLVHLKPKDEQQNILFKYLLNGTENELLPKYIQEYNAFLKDTSLPLPKAPLSALLSHCVTKEHWEQLLPSMTWNQVRMNLNNLAKYKLFNNSKTLNYVETLLSDTTKIPKNMWAFNINQTLSSLIDVPQTIVDTLEKIQFYLLKNAPSFTKDAVLFVDSSGSMSYPLRTSYTSRNPLTYSKIASFFAAGICLTNENILAVPFDTTLHFNNKINSKDDFNTIFNKFSLHGGGTNVHCGIEYLLENKIKKDVLIIISDNESWRHTKKAFELYEQYRNTINPDLIVINWDILPNTTAQHTNSNKTYLVSGYSDTVYKLINYILSQESPKTISQLIENMEIN